MLCRGKFYLPPEYIDIKHYPDTTALTFDQTMREKAQYHQAKNVTMSDFVLLPVNMPNAGSRSIFVA